MKKICLLFTAVLFLGISSALNAQNLTVSGFVTDASSGEGVPYASVQLKGSTKVYTMTDANGAYSISVPGSASLTVSCLGYTTADILVDGRTALDIRPIRTRTSSTM